MPKKVSSPTKTPGATPEAPSETSAEESSPLARTLAEVLAEAPEGFRVLHNGRIIPVGETVEVADLASLTKILGATRTVVVPINGRSLQMQVRPLNDDEVARADALVRGVLPPPKVRIEGTGIHAKKITDGYDDRDPIFVEKVREQLRFARSMRVAMGLVKPEIAIEGQDAAAVHALLMQSGFTSQILDVLDDQIRAISTTPAQVADFF